MKEKISSKLKELVGKNNLLNLSERTIEKYAEVISHKVQEETELTEEFYSDHLGILCAMNGQIYADLKVKIEDAKKDNIPEPQAPPINPTPEGDAEPLWAKKLQERLSSVEGKLTAKEKTEMLQGNMDKAKSILVEKGAKNAKVLNIALKLMDFNDDMTPEEIAEKAKSVYDSTYKDLYGDGAAPASSGSFSTEKPISSAEREKAIQENQKKYRNQIV